MSFKTTVKYFIPVLVFAFMLILVLLPQILPSVLDKVITDKIVMETGLNDFHFDIRSMGLYRTDIGKIKIGTTADIDSINIDYNIGSLLRKRIDEIHISGLVVRAELNGSCIEFPDSGITKLLFPKPEVSARHGNNTIDKTKGDEKQILGALAYLPNKISITNSSFILKIRGNTFIVPFNLSAVIKRKEKSIQIVAEVFPFGEKIGISLQSDFKNNIKNVEIKSDSFFLGQADKLISMYFPGICLAGNSAIKISKIMKTTVKNGSSWEINISRAGIKSPFQAEIQKFTSVIDLQGSSFSTSGSFVISKFSDSFGASAQGGTTAKPIKIVSPVKINYSGKYVLEKYKGNPWNFSLHLENSDSQRLSFEAMQDKAIHVRKPVLDLSFKGRSLKGRGRIAGFCLNGDGNYDNTRLSFSKFKIKGKCDFNFNEKGNGLDFRFKTGTDSIKIIRDSFYSDFSGLKIIGNLHISRDLTPILKFETSSADALVKDDSSEIKINNINFTLPVVLPFVNENIHEENINPGIFSADNIIFQKHNLGRMAGKFFQTSSGCIIKGNAFITGLFKPGYKPVKINFMADAELTKEEHGIKAALKFHSGKFKISSDMIKEIYLNSDSDIDFHFLTSLKGSEAFNKNKLITGLNFDISDGFLSFKGKKFRANGIATSMKFDNLMNLRSLPGQTLTIDSISSNDIKISRALMKYSIESMHSFLIESLSFNWCDGRVTAGAMRLSKGKTSYDTILYCDRLKLARLLHQLGSFRAEGEGSLNGRIPLHYENGNLSFDRGFLFSTPGLGGKIKVEGTEVLTAGIPVNSPEFAEIDLAREALKNYKYKWAKIIFNTGHDDLLINMEFDGEPANILPFEYKKELGRFVKVDVTSPGSHFQGMKIDVNLKLPFNRVMKFTKILNKLLN